MIRFYIYLFITFLYIANSTAIAQTMIARTSAQRVPVGEPFEISFTIDGNPSAFTPPNMGALQILAGPNQSQSMTYVNGQMNQSVTLSYYATPKKEGIITIAGASAIVGGKAIACAPIKIEALKPDPASAKRRQEEDKAAMEKQRRMMQDPFSAFFGDDDPFFANGNKRKQEPSQKTNLKDNIFLRLSLNKSKAYVGEPILATFKIYTRVGVARSQATEIPKMNGFWQEEIEIKNPKVYNESVNGIQFTVAEIKKTILYPQRAGNLLVEPLKLDVIVQQQQASRSIFDQIFGAYQNVPITLQSSQLKVQVLPLPNTTTNFNGFVGKLNLVASIDKQKIKTNDAVNIKLQFTGKGNLSLLESPKLNIPADIEVYDPKISEKFSKTEMGTTGTKTIEYLLIPRIAGNYEIPSSTISYFDIDSKSYKELVIPSFSLEVEKGNGDNNNAIISSPSANNQILTKTDILYAKQDIDAFKPTQFYRSILFYLILFASFACFALMLFYTNKQIKDKGNVVFSKMKSANKIASKRLAKANVLLLQNKPLDFYLEIHQAVLGYLNYKFNISFAEMSKENIELLLKQNNVVDVNINNCTTLLNNCEMARFAPGTPTDMKDMYNTTTDLINNFEA